MGKLTTKQLASELSRYGVRISPWMLSQFTKAAQDLHPELQSRLKQIGIGVDAAYWLTRLPKPQQLELARLVGIHGLDLGM